MVYAFRGLEKGVSKSSVGDGPLVEWKSRASQSEVDHEITLEATKLAEACPIVLSNRVYEVMQK